MEAQNISVPSDAKRFTSSKKGRERDSEKIDTLLTLFPFQIFSIASYLGLLTANILRFESHSLIGALFLRTSTISTEDGTRLQSDSTRLLPGVYVLEIITDGFHDGPFELLYLENPLSSSKRQLLFVS